jgi:riboflavin kinase, archaea type
MHVLRAVVESGKREAAGFLALPWVCREVEAKTGLVPFPGTLNLRLRDPHSQALWARARRSGGRSIEPEAGFCSASCFPVLLNGEVRGAILLPDVEDYPTNLLEVVAPEGLRARLGLADGDECFLWLETQEECPTRER